MAKDKEEMMDASKAEQAISTFEQLRKGGGWTAVRALLRKSGKTVRVSVSEEAMGRYAAVIINGDGFVQLYGKAALQAAFTKPDDRFSPIKSLAQLREMIWQYDDSLPPEPQLIADILDKIEKIRLEYEAQKPIRRRKQAAA